MSFQVIYLTGAPASGKTTLCLRLQARVKSLTIYHYSELLADHLRRSYTDLNRITEDELREKSATVITPGDVEAVDDLLIHRVREKRQDSHVVIDSHAVTKESYGYRVTPFSVEKLRALEPTTIAMLYAESEEIARRIGADSGGRPKVTKFQADFHIALQAEVAISYALQLGLPVYLYDTTTSVDQAADKLSAKLNDGDRPESA